MLLDTSMANTDNEHGTTRLNKEARMEMGSAEKAELLELFESKQWLLLPKEDQDPHLDALLDRGFQRSQISRHFLVWRRIADSASVILPVLPIDEIKQSLQDRSDDAPTLIASTLASHEIVEMRDKSEYNYDESAMDELLDLSIWENVREKVISNLAYCYARSSKKGVSAKTKTYDEANETCIQDEREKFGMTQTEALTDFFDCFARAFVGQFHKSITEPDVEAMDDDVVAGILASKHSLPNETAECVYYISGFILQAIMAKGIRRKTGKSSAYYRFASAKSLDQAGVTIAKAGSLPTRRTDETPNSALPYPGNDFYLATVRIEQIYQALLTTENLLSFGPDAVPRIRSKLLACDTLRQQFSIGKKTYPKVVDHIVHTFMHLRGEDFLTRMLAKSQKRLIVANPVANYIKTDKSAPEPVVEEVMEDTAVEESDMEVTEEDCSESAPEADLATMDLSWETELPIETVFTQLEDAMNVSAAGDDPIAAAAAVETGFAKLKQSGLFAASCRDWDAKLEKDKTLLGFRDHFRAACADLDLRLAAKKEKSRETATEDTAVEEINMEETEEDCSESAPEADLATMKISWETELPIETVFTQLEDAMNVSAAGDDPIAAAAAVETGFTKLKQSGLFTASCRDWDAKPEAEKTYLAFQDHFRAACADLDLRLAAKKEKSRETATENTAVDEFEMDKSEGDCSKSAPETATKKPTRNAETSTKKATRNTAVDEFKTVKPEEDCNESAPEANLATKEAELPIGKVFSRLKDYLSSAGSDPVAAANAVRIETVFTQLEDYLSVTGNDPVAAATAVETGFTKLEESGLFEASCRDWHAKPEAEKTPLAFRDHFRSACADLDQRLAAKKEKSILKAKENTAANKFDNGLSAAVIVEESARAPSCTRQQPCLSRQCPTCQDLSLRKTKHELW